MEDLRFPIGRYRGPSDFNGEAIQSYIRTIKEYPGHITALVEHMSENQLDTRYRPEGWTVRQVVHHTVDSHLNAYLRFKRIITEENPTILPYDQAAWAALPDSTGGNIQAPLRMISALHERWVNFMNSLTDDDFERVYTHPEHSGTQKLFFLLGLYAWHCNHHFGHIEQLSLREGW